MSLEYVHSIRLSAYKCMGFRVNCNKGSSGSTFRKIFTNNDIIIIMDFKRHKQHCFYKITYLILKKCANDSFKMDSNTFRWHRQIA